MGAKCTNTGQRAQSRELLCIPAAFREHVVQLPVIPVNAIYRAIAVLIPYSPHGSVQVGELWIAAMARNGGDIRAPQMKAIQAERVDLLAVLLNALLRRWVEGDEEGFLVRHGSCSSIVCEH